MDTLKFTKLSSLGTLNLQANADQQVINALACTPSRSKAALELGISHRMISIRISKLNIYEVDIIKLRMDFLRRSDNIKIKKNYE